jgi:hypothetical protein
MTRAPACHPAIRRQMPLTAAALAIVIAASTALLSSSGITTLVTRSTAGVHGDGTSGAGNITADGRYVVFFSISTTLAPEDTDRFFDVFVRDLQSGTTTLESISSDGTKGIGTSSWPFITDNGRYITFQSDAQNLVAGGTNGRQHIYVRDRVAGTTELVSMSTAGVQADNLSDVGNISGDGRFVVFISYASNLVPGDSNGSPDVFVRDRQAGTTTRVSVSSSGGQANGSSLWPRLSADGRFVAFTSAATNLAGTDANGTVEDIYVHDMQTRTTRRVSLSSAGVQANSVSTGASLSSDGQTLAFISFAGNLVAGDTNVEWDVYVRDLQTGVTERVSVSSSGGQGNDESGAPYMSPDGRFVSFHSVASNLVAGDTNGFLDVFRHDRLTGRTDLVSLSSTGFQGNADTNNVAISADGSRVAFYSNASNYVADDVNGSLDVFVRELTVSDAPPSPATLASLTVNPNSVAGGTQSTGTVTLPDPAPAGGLVVTLASEVPSVASVPSSITVPPGETSGSFTISTFQSSTRRVGLSATHLDTTVFSFITVGPTALSTLSLSPTSVAGGSPSTGTVTLNAAAPDGGAAVSLSVTSSSTTVPASIIVPAGATSASFSISTSPVTETTFSAITGSYGGVARTAVLTLNPAPTGTAPPAPSLISPANDATPSQPVTFDWNDVANAASYEIQIDSTSSIASPFVATAVVTISQATIDSLPAQRLWWRVRARNSSGVFGPFSATRRLTPRAATAAAALSAITVNPSSVVGGTASTGRVTLSAAAPSGGAIVALTSSNTGAATVPISVTVAGGATSASFTAATASVTSSTAVTMTASYNGASRTTTLTVTPAPPPASLQALTLNPTSVTGGATSQGIVTLTSAAPVGGAVVTLTSSNTGVAVVPGSVSVAAGATSATFASTTSAVSASTAVTITASHDGLTRTATLTINPQAQGVTLTLTASGRSGERVTSNPAGISVNVGSTGTASFAAGTSITLTVSNGRDAVWSGACSSNGQKRRSCTFTLNGNVSVTANVQ